MNGFRTTLLAIIFTVAILPICGQQGGTARYVYDDNGRLRSVITPNGEAAIYDYDPAGNFTGIRRLAADAFAIIDFTLKKGVAGDLVSLFGVGFANGTAAVSFNGAAATVLQSTPTLIVAQVPDNATTGLVSITNTKGTVMTAGPFTVLDGIKIVPTAASLKQGDTVQFIAHVSGAFDHAVQWSVNGIVGGNTTFGTVSPTGLYAAPGFFFIPIIVRAAVIAQPSLFKEAKVTLLTISDNAAAPSASVSISRSQDAGSGTVVSPNVGVSVGRVSSADAQATATPNSGVSVGRLSSENAQQTAAPADNVSATNGPNVTSVSPNQISAGTTVTITVSGSNFTGATAVKILNSDRSSDLAVTVTNLTINGGGASLTATVTVNGSAALGSRIVVVTTATGQSLLGTAAGNTIQITH